MSLADQQWCPTSVQVTVLQARGLRIKGKSGTNDAYAIMQVGKEKFQTSVVEKSVAPVWKEEAAFDLHPGAHGSERNTLHVHVLHRALVGPDKLLGQAVINLLQLSEDKTRSKTEWFKLLDKTGKPDKDRGEVLVDIQFMRNNMTASMFDLSAAGKSRSRLGKFKDKVRGKKKESDSGSNMLPSFTQVLTDSEEEANGDGEVAASKDGKQKKHKMKSLFSPKSNLQKNMSQSMSVLPGKNSTLSGSQSSGLNVDSSEGKKKFKFKIHKRSGSSDSKDSSSGHQKQPPVEQSNLCINGSHIYCEEPPTRTSRIGSNFSLASSGHGSMEEVPENSPPSVDSLRAVRQYSPWTEEEEEAEVENTKEDESRRDGEERMRMEEEEKVRRQQEELERMAEEEERKKAEEEKVKREEERIRREEDERVRREEEERERLAEEKRRLEEQERRKIEEERIKIEEEERRRRQEEEEERVRREEERERLAEEQRRLEEQERRKIEEEEKRQREEEEERIKIEEEERRRKEEEEEEERVRREEHKLAEEKRRLEEEKRRRIEEERAEEERRQREEEERRQEEEERLRKEKEEYERLMEEKRILEEEKERIEAEEKNRKEEEERKRMEEERRRKDEQERKQREEEEMRRQEDEERARKEREEYERLMEEKRKLEEEKKRIRMEEEKRRQEEDERKQREEEERIKKEEIKRREEEERVRKEKEEYERLMEEKRKLEEEKERTRMEEEKRRQEEEERKRMEKERRKEEEEKRRQEEEERIRIEEEERRRAEEERARKEKEEYERLEEEKMKQEEERRRIVEEERFRKEEQERMRMEEEKRRQEEKERARKEKEEMERLAEERRRLEEQERRRIEEEEKVRKEEEERIRREERAERERKEKVEKEKLKRDAEEQKKKENKDGQKVSGKKSKVSSPAVVASTNPFDENYSWNPSEEIPDSPPGAKDPADQQRCQSAVSSLGSKIISTDEKELISSQREKRPAPQPPGRNQADKPSQREQDASTRHLGQINVQNKDKDVKTVSVPPQRSVQTIVPLSKSPTDSKDAQSSTQSSTAKGTTVAGKHNKRPAPARPQSVEEEPKTTSTAEKKQTVYGLNPFEDDEDENELTAQSDAGPVCWPPAGSHAADKDAASQTKIKSSKVAHAPPPPKNDGTLINRNTEGDRVTDDTVPGDAAHKACDPKPEALNPLKLQESPVQEPQPVKVQNTVEAGVKMEGPPKAPRRLQPVKPLNSVEQQSVSVVQGESKSTGVLSEAQDKAKVDDTGLKGPYSQLTQEELISLVLKQETQLSERDKKISELEQYIDNLLVRVIEEQPSILMSLNSLKKAA